MEHQFLSSQFSSQNIVVAGAGGTGTQVITGLARMVVALSSLGLPAPDVTVYDPDQVSTANVGRQLFANADIGTNKAIALVQRINAYFGLDWTAKPEAFTNPAYSDILVISCVDSRKARKEIWEGIHKKSLYWLDTGNGNHTGQAILGHTAFHRASWPMRNKHVLLPTAYDLFPELLDDSIPDDDATPSCSLAVALEKQDLMVNQTVATHAMELVWQLYRNRMLSHHGFFFDCSAFRLTPLPVDKEIWKRYLQQAKNYQPFSTRAA